jgi:predicted amidohydrolase
MATRGSTVRRSDTLRVALVVPDYRFDWTDDEEFGLANLRERCQRGEVDLVVFPEGYIEGSPDDVEDLVKDLGTAVLAGITHEAGFELAVYRNPRAGRDETAEHLYVKHSTARCLAYDWPGYAGPADCMFDPIRIKGHAIGVLICHDMFLGLPVNLERTRGATMFVDISGGDVNEAKWTNVVRGRSVELDSPFLCTMARRGGTGKALALAYSGLHRYKPQHDSTGAATRGGFSIIEVEAGALGVADGADQAYTDKAYADITVALGTRADADISIAAVGGRITVVSKHRGLRVRGAWIEVTVPVGRVGILPVAVERIDDGTLVHREDLGAEAFDHYIVAYVGTSSRTHSELLALAKLRAIEHRVGVVIFTETVREVLKTNRYKNIQRFVERQGRFGLNAEFLGGVWSTASGTPTQGIPRDRFEEYRALLPRP